MSKGGTSEEASHLTLPVAHVTPVTPITPVTSVGGEQRLRQTYVSLFHELQFRAAKNALMNYYQGEVLDERSRLTKSSAGVMAGVSAAGVLAGIFQRGKALASRFGLAGLTGLPVAAAAEVFSNCSSEFLPSYQERAKKHIQAAAAWNRICDRARAARLRLAADPAYDQESYVALHDQLIADKEAVQRTVVLPRDLHRKFNEDSDSVFASMKRRKEAFKKFQKYHLDEDNEESEKAGKDEKDTQYYL